MALENKQKKDYSLTKKEIRAKAVLIWERAGVSFWKSFFWLIGFAGIFMMDLPVISDEPVREYLPLVFWLVFAVFLYSGIRTFKWPTTGEARRRLEQDSGLDHRVLSEMDDNLANPEEKVTRNIWSLRNRNLQKIAINVRNVCARPQLSTKDPYALRYLALILLFAGFAFSGNEWFSKIEAGASINLFPEKTASIGKENDYRASIQIIPPGYSGLGEVIIQGISDENTSPLEILEGSIIKVRVSGGWGNPVLKSGETSLPLNQTGKGSYFLEAPVVPGEMLVLKQGLRTLVSFPYKMLKDTPPSLELTGDPVSLRHGEIRIPLKVRDDFGIRNLRATPRLDEDVVKVLPAIGQEVVQERLVMSPAGAEVEIDPVFDFASHPWAGLSVKITIEAFDYNDQKTEITLPAMTLPERKFNNPFSASIYERRQRLVWSPEGDIYNTVMYLENMLEHPGIFEGDFTSYLAVRSSASRMKYAADRETTEKVIPLLWDIAVRMDGGDFEIARNQLRQAQQNLEKALADPNATDEEISLLMTQLKQALSNYMYELSRAVAEKGNMKLLPKQSQSLDSDVLKAVMDKMQALALSGDRKGAIELLSGIGRMVDAFDASEMAGMPKDMQFMDKAKDQLKELYERQKKLLEQTEGLSRKKDNAEKQELAEWLPDNDDDKEEYDDEVKVGLDDMPPPPSRDSDKPKVSTRNSYNEQESIRHDLGEIMKEAGDMMGEIPENMGKAEREMKSSSDNLEQNNPGDSIQNQKQALEYLQQSSEQMAQKLSQRMQQMIMFGMSGSGYDPLGRETGDKDGKKDFFGVEIDIPDGKGRGNVDEIMKTLRKRSGELSRPEEELDYFKRLLRQF